MSDPVTVDKQLPVLLEPLPKNRGVYVTNQFVLQVKTWGTLSGVTFRVNWRVERAGILPKIDTHLLTADSAKTIGGSPKYLPLGNGYLTIVSVSVSTSATGLPQRGQTFIEVNLQDKQSAESLGLKLISGYLVWGRDLEWTPDNPFDEDPSSGPGYVHSVHTASQALAASGVVVWPSGGTGVDGARWKIKHILVKLVTSATVGNRTILLYATDGANNPSSGAEGSNVLIEWVNSATFGTGRTVAASTTERYMVTTFAVPATEQGANLGITLLTAMSQPIDMFANANFGLFPVVWIQDTAHIDSAADAVVIDLVLEEWIVPQ